MKLIQINQEHYIVVDETIDINENDYTFKNGEIGQVSYLMQDNGHIITHSTKPLAPIKELMEKGYDNILPLDIDEIKELIGEVNVEKKAQNIHYENQSQGLNADGCFNQYQGFIKGYNQALEDNKEKKYTEEDIRKAILMARVRIENVSPKYSIDEIIQSLQPKTEWDVEIVDGKLKLN